MFSIRLQTTTIDGYLKHGFCLLGIFWMMLYSLAILQDYIFSQVRETSFYLSETMLYNIFWLLFILFIPCLIWQSKKIPLKLFIHKVCYFISAGLIFSLFHILVFVGVFILVSHLCYTIPHDFLVMLKSAISNHWYLAFMAYSFIPFLFLNPLNFQKINETFYVPRYDEMIWVKQKNKKLSVDIADIQVIISDKPYTAILTNTQKYLDNRSLKKLEEILDPVLFLRVHRSSIINKNHIISLRSRKNGDYDATLTNGQSVRLSRHYRQQWFHLINH